MKTIIVCCGSSMITSSVARKKITDYLATQNIQVNIIQCKFAEVAGNVKMYHPSVIIPTGALKDELAQGVPVVLGTCFVTGVGEKETLEKIRDILAD